MSDELNELDDVDEDEPTGKPGSDDVDAGFVCPECERVFDSALKLGAHRKGSHGVAGTSKDRRNRKRAASPRRDRPNNTGGSSDRARKVSETLRELVDLFERNGTNVEGLTLAAVIRRDADKIGEALAALAERRMFAPLGAAIDTMFGAGGPLSFITALGPTLRKVVAGRPQRLTGNDSNGAVDLQQQYDSLLAEHGVDYANRWAALNGIELAAP